MAWVAHWADSSLAGDTALAVSVPEGSSSLGPSVYFQSLGTVGPSGSDKEDPVRRQSMVKGKYDHKELGKEECVNLE